MSIVARYHRPYPFYRTALTSEPIRPQFGSEFPTLESPQEQSGNNKSSFTFLRVILYSG